MIAVVEIGGKQYTVEKDQTIEVDNQNLAVGAVLETPALLIADAEGKKVQVGTPTVEGAKVTLTVIENFKADKIRVFKMKAKKRQTTTLGFRAMRTLLKVSSIA